MRETFPLGKKRDGARIIQSGVRSSHWPLYYFPPESLWALKPATLTHMIGQPLKRLVVLQLMVSRNDRTSLGSGAGFRLTRQH